MQMSQSLVLFAEAPDFVCEPRSISPCADPAIVLVRMSRHVGTYTPLAFRFRYPLRGAALILRVVLQGRHSIDLPGGAPLKDLVSLVQ